MKNTLSAAPNKKRNAVLTIILVAIIIAVLCMLQADTAKHNYAISIIERSLIYAIVAVAMNLLTGFTGLFSLGQAGFMAIGAYTVAMFTIPVETRPAVYYISGISDSIANIQLPFPVALILGGVFAAVLAALIGIPVLRLKSDYLAIATLGVSEIIRAVISAPQLDRITNGSYGLKNIPGFSTIFTPTIITVICIGIMVLIINSSYGRAFKAIRENDVAAEAMGINLFKHKEMAFIISSFFTGIAGGLLAVYMRSIDAKTFQVTLTYNILLMVVIGGIGSVTGSVIGAFRVHCGHESLRFSDEPLIIAAVQSGKADFGAAGMSVTEDRLASVDFTEPYYSASQVIIVKK